MTHAVHHGIAASSGDVLLYGTARNCVCQQEDPNELAGVLDGLVLAVPK